MHEIQFADSISVATDPQKSIRFVSPSFNLNSFLSEMVVHATLVPLAHVVDPTPQPVSSRKRKINPETLAFDVTRLEILYKEEKALLIALCQPTKPPPKKSLLSNARSQIKKVIKTLTIEAALVEDFSKTPFVLGTKIVTTSSLYSMFSSFLCALF